MSDVNIVSKAKEALSSLERAKQNALEGIGLAAETNAKEDPAMPVNTGRARNSISHAVKSPDVYTGSNVEYFPYIEFGSPTISARHVLKNAASTHGEEYKKIAEAAMKNA